jgi:23S rRNA (uracil1939-C5)-methyltransferase
MDELAFRRRDTDIHTGAYKADVLILDPPRSGTTPRFIEAAAHMAPERIIYVSCSPDTLARDLRLFRKKGYRAKEAQGFDLFPYTEHVETVCLLTHKD